MEKILLVDDEPSIVSVLSTLLKSEGHEVTSTLSGEKAQELIASEHYDLLLSDISMSPVNGMELLRLVHGKTPSFPVIMLTAFGTIETAIESLKLGAYDYITKPFKVDELLATVRRALEQGKAVTDNEGIKAQPGARYRLENIVAESPAMIDVCEMIKKVASTNAVILIQGDGGTGKTLVAQTIHACSHRKEGPFRAVHCADLSEPLLESELFGHRKGAFTGAADDKEGLIEAAEGGTVFLDEISSLPLAIQGKFLRVLQEKHVRRAGSNGDIPVNVRFIAATSAHLETLVGEGRFHKDLFSRISVIPIVIKPLRERPEDILPLVRHFLQVEIPPGQPQPVLDSEVAAIFETYVWPGNVPELEKAVKHGVASARDNIITRDVLPPEIAATQAAASALARGDKVEKSNPEKAKSLKAFLRSKEKEYLKQVLSMSGGDREKAAKSLKISPANFSRKFSETDRVEGESR